MDSRLQVFLILVTRHTLMSSYNITSPRGLRVHLPVTYFLFRDTTFHLVLTLSASLRPKYGTPYLFTSANLKLYSSFRRHLKTHYFISAHLAPYRPLQCALILIRDFGAI